MKTFLAFACVLVLITACGSGTNTPGDDDIIEGNFTKAGFVGLADFSTSQGGVVSTSISGFAGFAELTQAVTEIPENPFAAISDTCFVTADNTTEPPPPVDDPTENATSISAGDFLLIEEGDQVLLTLTKVISNDLITYEDSEEDQTLPAQGITVTIPGEDFPAFGDIAPLVVSSPSDVNNVTLDTTFTWNAGNSENIFLFYVTQESPPSLAACYAKDDGSFTFPDQTKTELEAAGFTTGSFFQPQRISVKVATDDDAYLVLYRGTSEPVLIPSPPAIE
jgi:hypothetical protein